MKKDPIASILPNKLTPLTQIPVETAKDLQQYYSNNPPQKALAEQIWIDHETLIKTILEDEEELIATHKRHID